MVGWSRRDNVLRPHVYVVFILYGSQVPAYKLVGEFSGDSTYSESLLLSPKLASDMMSLSESAGGLGEEILPSVGCPRFEFLLKLPTAVGVAMSGAAVLVRTLAAWEVSARDGKTGRSDPLVGVLVDDAGASG